jgi:hypothetical protein
MDRSKRLLVRIRETLKRLRSTSASRCWLVWVSGAWQWALGSSKAANAARLAVFTSAHTALYLGSRNQFLVLNAGFERL